LKRGSALSKNPKKQTNTSFNKTRIIFSQNFLIFRQKNRDPCGRSVYFTHLISSETCQTITKPGLDPAKVIPVTVYATMGVCYYFMNFFLGKICRVKLLNYENDINGERGKMTQK